MSDNRAEQEQIRLERVDVLMALGESSVPALLAMLTDPGWIVRRAVVAALATLGAPALGPLCELLRTQRDHEGRLAAAVDALVALVAPNGAVEAAVAALADDPNPAVAADAAQILGRRRNTSAIPVLVTLTTHADDNVAVAAIEALGRVGGRAAVESLVRLVQNGSFFRVFPAIDVLGRSGDPRAIAPLAALLGRRHFALEAARALGMTGDRRAVAPLAGLLLQPTDSMVRVAALALVKLHERSEQRFGTSAPIEEELRKGAADPAVVRRLVQVIPGADESEQVALCRVLGDIGSDAAAPALTQLLGAAPAVATAAAQALRKLGEHSEVQLIAGLIEGDSARRLAILPIIGMGGMGQGPKTGDGQVQARGPGPGKGRQEMMAAVATCLEDAEPAVRAAACEALGRLANPAAVTSLFPKLRDANPRVVQAALGAIQALGGPETERLALIEGRAESPIVRRAALRILAYFGWASALPLLVEALRDPDPRVREAAIQGLPFVEDPRALDELLEVARAPNERLRASAMRALGHCRGDVRVTARLLKGLADSDAWVRYYACQSLGRLGVETAATSIARLLVDPAGQVRVAAIEALSHLRSELAFDALRQAAESPDPDVMRAALVGLGISRRPEAEPLLVAAARAPDAATRLVAISAVADFESPEALDALKQAAVDVDDSVRRAAINFLAGRAGEESTDALVELLPLSPERERITAALSVWTEGRIPALIALMAEADDELAPELVAALVRMQHPDANAALLRLLPTARPPDPPLGPPARKAVAAALPILSSPEAFTVLQRTAAEDPDPEVRRIASLLLAQ
ncbi:MAG TPA: HEAT repeat domain-containing protein [Polyangia bacterium]|nr:HEAT repeat domain-containing protein [Polyangia bacterium]